MTSPMPTALRARRLGALLLGCLIIPCLHAGAPAPVIAGDIAVSRVWARATPPGVSVGAVYLTIENRGRQADALLGASSPVADEARFHGTTQQHGMSHMAMAGDLAIAGGAMLQAGPAGLHLMLDGLKQPLVAGSSVAVTLRFRRAGDVVVSAQVIPITAPPPDQPRQPATSLQHPTD